MTLPELRQNWTDTPEYHKIIHDSMSWLVSQEPELSVHRDYIQSKVWGFGERSFWWAWKLILESLPKYPKLLELGVFKGATLSVWKLLRPDSQVFGVTPLSDIGLDWNHEDGYYANCIKKIHEDFNLEQPTIIVGKTDEPNAIKQAMGEYDVVYVDAGHSTSEALFDLTTYAPMVKKGGFLVIDDCCCDMKMEFGYFQGILSVQEAFDQWDKTGFEFVFNVKHLRVMQRK